MCQFFKMEMQFWHLIWIQPLGRTMYKDQSATFHKQMNVMLPKTKV
jgi:hypothetical protein